MKVDDVPHDPNAIYGGQRKLLYAVDKSGEYTGVNSEGWEAETFATLSAVEALARLRDDAWARAKRGESSPLEYHMYRRRMEPATLAAASGIWRWRLARHLKPAAFARLSRAILARYADALGLTVDELRALPETPEA
jgi:hypothetical protein